MGNTQGNPTEQDSNYPCSNNTGSNTTNDK